MKRAAGTSGKQNACGPWQEELKAYADGELSFVRRFFVHRHLTGCAACRAEVETARRIAGSLRQTDEAVTVSAASPALDPALRSRILSAMREAAPPGRTEARPSFRPAIAFAAAAAMVLFVGIVSSSWFRAATERSQSAAVFSASEPSAAASAGGGASSYQTGATPAAASQPGATATAGANRAIAGTPRIGEGARESTPTLTSASPPTMKQTARAATAVAARPQATPASARSANSKTVAAPSAAQSAPVHREESLTLLVGQVAEASAEVERLARASGGALTGRSEVHAEDADTGATHVTLGFQFPSHRSDRFVSQLSRIGRVTDRTARPERQAEQRKGSSADAAPVITNITVHLRER